MHRSRTIATQILPSPSSPSSPSTNTIIAFKLQQEYTPKPLPFVPKKVNSLVTLTLDEEGKVRYHKDMWNEKDYSHEGLGKVFKTLNGDYLTGVTRPPGGLKEGAEKKDGGQKTIG